MGILVGEKLDVVWPYILSPENQMCPGLHPEQRGQQGREGILPLCSALVRPTWNPAPSSGVPAQEGHRTAGGSPEDGYRNDQRDERLHLGRKTETAGVVQRTEGSRKILLQSFNTHMGLIINMDPTLGRAVIWQVAVVLN